MVAAGTASQYVCQLAAAQVHHMMQAYQKSAAATLSCSSWLLMLTASQLVLQAGRPAGRAGGCLEPMADAAA